MKKEKRNGLIIILSSIIIISFLLLYVNFIYEPEPMTQERLNEWLDLCKNDCAKYNAEGVKAKPTFSANYCYCLNEKGDTFEIWN